jgi:hypothetical protein
LSTPLGFLPLSGVDLNTADQEEIDEAFNNLLQNDQLWGLFRKLFGDSETYDRDTTPKV